MGSTRSDWRNAYSPPGCQQRSISLAERSSTWPPIPRQRVDHIKAEDSGWTALTDIDGHTSIVHGNLVCFVGPIRQEELDADPTLAGKARRLATYTGEDRYPL